jgi:hypothetical protein
VALEDSPETEVSTADDAQRFHQFQRIWFVGAEMSERTEVSERLHAVQWESLLSVGLSTRSPKRLNSPLEDVQDLGTRPLSREVLAAPGGNARGHQSVTASDRRRSARPSRNPVGGWEQSLESIWHPARDVGSTTFA